jgi:hypothetical protein
MFNVVLEILYYNIQSEFSISQVFTQCIIIIIIIIIGYCNCNCYFIIFSI